MVTYWEILSGKKTLVKLEAKYNMTIPNEYRDCLLKTNLIMIGIGVSITLVLKHFGGI